MNLRQIPRRVSGGGFQPFALRTSDGQEYPVRHLELVLIAPTSLAVVDRDGQIVTLDPLHIVALRNLRPQRNADPKPRLLRRLEPVQAPPHPSATSARSHPSLHKRL